MATIRPLERRDWDQWLALWQGYLGFYREQLSEATTQSTFERLTGGDDQMFALIAIDATDGERAVGLVHCLTHPTTWSPRPYCYLEDLFVALSARGTDVGRQLIEAAKAESEARGAAHLYWHTQEFNGRARSLYDQVAQLTSFIVYQM